MASTKGPLSIALIVAVTVSWPNRLGARRPAGRNGIGDYWGLGQSVLSFIANRSSFLIGELLLRKLIETVVVQGNAPHDRPRFLVSHLIGNRASFLCTKAPMIRIPETNFLHLIN